jgi:hypothetical protein
MGVVVAVFVEIAVLVILVTKLRLEANSGVKVVEMVRSRL